MRDVASSFVTLSQNDSCALCHTGSLIALITVPSPYLSLFNNNWIHQLVAVRTITSPFVTLVLSYPRVYMYCQCLNRTYLCNPTPIPSNESSTFQVSGQGTPTMIRRPHLLPSTQNPNLITDPIGTFSPSSIRKHTKRRTKCAFAVMMCLC
jgi:hypothetical protein